MLLSPAFQGQWTRAQAPSWLRRRPYLRTSEPGSTLNSVLLSIVLMNCRARSRGN